MSDVSDNEMSESDVEVEPTDLGDDEMLVTPADPNEGLSESEDEAEEPEDEIEAEEPEEEIETEEPEEEEIDIKSVSNYNKEIIIVKPEERQTPNILSTYEQTETVSIRATQISQYNNCMVDITGLDDPIKMAKRELMMRKCPLNVRRFIGEVKDPKTNTLKSYYEDFVVNEMQFAIEYTDI